jgi:hypothetical protein
MPRGAMPYRFHRMTWIYWVQVVFVFLFGAFGLLLGLVFSTGLTKPVHGRVAQGPGTPLLVIGSVLLAYGALALVNVLARRAPVIRLCREGIEVDRYSFEFVDDREQPPGSHSASPGAVGGGAV